MSQALPPADILKYVFPLDVLAQCDFMEETFIQAQQRVLQ